MRLFAIIFLLSCAAAPPPGPPRNTTQLAAIEASADLDGGVIGKSEARATIVVVFASWCQHCHRELAVLDKLRANPALRVVGVNYRGHEEYDDRGNAEAVRKYVADHAPWMRVVAAGEQLFDVLGRPPKVPTLYVYDRTGALVETYDRRDRAMPDVGELRELLQRLGA